MATSFNTQGQTMTKPILLRVYNIVSDNGIPPPEVYFDDLHEHEDFDDVLTDLLNMRVLSYDVEDFALAKKKVYPLTKNFDSPFVPNFVRVDLSSFDELIAKTAPHLKTLGCSEIVYYEQDDHVKDAEFFYDEECTRPASIDDRYWVVDIMLKVYPIGAAVIWDGADNAEMFISF
jgi:hypothetical protein